MATTIELSGQLDALRALLQEVGPTVAKVLTDLILSKKGHATKQEALHFLAARLAAAAGKCADPIGEDKLPAAVAEPTAEEPAALVLDESVRAAIMAEATPRPQSSSAQQPAAQYSPASGVSAGLPVAEEPAVEEVQQERAAAPAAPKREQEQLQVPKLDTDAEAQAEAQAAEEREAVTTADMMSAPAEAEAGDTNLAVPAEVAATVDAPVEAEAEQDTAASPFAPELPPLEYDAMLEAEGEGADDEGVPAEAPLLPLLAEAEEGATEEATAGEAAGVEDPSAIATVSEVDTPGKAGSAGVGADGQEHAEGDDAL